MDFISRDDAVLLGEVELSDEVIEKLRIHVLIIHKARRFSFASVFYGFGQSFLLSQY